MKYSFFIIIIYLSINFGFSQDSKLILKEYKNVKKRNSQQCLTEFINKYPKSKYIILAKDERIKLDSIDIVISTFLGNEKRNYYGNKAPAKLDTIWKLFLGEGQSPAYGGPKIWKGAGWTGQPLFVREKGIDYLILGTFDYNLKKIEAKTGKVVWEYKFDDIIKGTATIWVNKNADNIEERYVIMQGSRLGHMNKHDDKYIPNFRGISYISGKELWRMNSKKTYCYSRDVDGSALVVGDTAYIDLENGWFTVFNPDKNFQKIKDEMKQPEIYNEILYYTDSDTITHGNDLVSESSPTLLNEKIYTPSGSGHVYGYNIKTQKNDWNLYLGTDINGSAPVTYDNCLLIPVEKQYMPGKGGVMKIDPSKSPEKSVIWYFPTENLKWFHWDGGIIGSVSINDTYAKGKTKKVAVFIDVTGHLYVVEHDKIDKTKTCIGPDEKIIYNMPKLLFDEKIIGTIATPIIIDNKIVATTDEGIFLYEIDLKNNKLTLLDKIMGMGFDATPIAVDGRIYVASTNGYLYCFGKIK